MQSQFEAMTSPRQITVRNPAPELTRRLKAMAEKRGESLNATVLRLLSQAVGMDERRARLETYMTSTDADREELEEASRVQRGIDLDLWR